MTLADFRARFSGQVLKSVALAALLLFVAAGCAAPAPPPVEQVEFTGEIMGTTYHIKVVAAMSDGETAAMAEAIESALKDVDAKMSTYKPDSEVSRLNQAPAGVPFALSESTFHVFTLGQQVNRETEGAFDITVGPLVNAWGFGPGGPGNTPDDNELAALRALVGPGMITLDPATRTVTKAADAVYCDPASVAEGYAVDRVAETIAARSQTNFMVEVGGEVRASGTNAQGVPWKIAVEKPLDDGRAVQEVVGISGTSLSTSGNYRKFYMHEGKRISHAIDPKTGRPVDHALASASVIHESCALADAYSTAIMVLGPEAGLAFAEKLGLPVLLIIHGENGEFLTRQTKSFESYVVPGPAAAAP